MRAGITLFRLAGGLVVALLITFVILLKLQSGYYLLLPDVAHPVAPLVHVTGGTPAKDGGELFFVDVQEERASELDRLFPWLHSHATFVPAKEIVPPGATDQQVVHVELRQMATSKLIAAAVAEQQMGYHTIDYTGALVEYVAPKTHAFGKVKRGDVIDSVNGKPSLTLAVLHSFLGQLRPGAVVTLGIRRGSSQQTVRVQTVAKKVNGTVRAEVGVIVEQAYRIVHPLPKKVAIDTGDIGGPSAGLAFTLDVMSQLGHNVTHGYKVAATGQMNIDGTVSAIGGVEQKTWGAREAGAQVFLVPVDGGNAKLAERYAGPDLKIIPVTSIGQALQALAALPKAP